MSAFPSSGASSAEVRVRLRPPSIVRAGAVLGVLGVVAVLAVLIAGCGATATPTSSRPASASQAASAPASSDPSAAASAGMLAIDRTLLAQLPASLNGLDRQNDADADASIQTDPSLAAIGSAYVTAFYVQPSSGDSAYAIVSRLRGGTISDATYKDWRETYGTGACGDAGGVIGQAETTLGIRQVDVTRCSGAQQVYYVLIGDRGVLLTITSTGQSQLGRDLVEQLPH
jgi:hypothetical protein